MSRDPMVPGIFKVSDHRFETGDVFTLELEPLDEQAEVRFEPGQFNMIYAPAVGEVAISLSGGSSEKRRILHTIRAVGSVTRVLRDVSVGAQLGLRGPFGSTWPLREARGRDVLLVAGGVGLAPLRSAFHEILAHREEFGKVALLYGTRTPSDILYQGELRQWTECTDLQVMVTVDRAAVGWDGSVGVAPALISRVSFDPARAYALICGPELMMKFTVNELLARNIPRDRIFVSLERNMKCALGFCGHCQLREKFICRDGPVFPYSAVEGLMKVREL